MVFRYARGVRYKLWKKNHTMTRGKLAADLSQFKNMERIAKENRPVILLEDDAAFPPKITDWYGVLLQVLRELPQVSHHRH